LANGAADGDAVLARQHHVENDGVVLVARRERERLRSRGSLVHDVQRLAKAACDRGTQHSVVFGQQNPHAETYVVNAAPPRSPVAWWPPRRVKRARHRRETIRW